MLVKNRHLNVFVCRTTTGELNEYTNERGKITANGRGSSCKREYFSPFLAFCIATASLSLTHDAYVFGIAPQTTSIIVKK